VLILHTLQDELGEESSAHSTSRDPLLRESPFLLPLSALLSVRFLSSWQDSIVRDLPIDDYGLRSRGRTPSSSVIVNRSHPCHPPAAQTWPQRCVPARSTTRSVVGRQHSRRVSAAIRGSLSWFGCGYAAPSSFVEIPSWEGHHTNRSPPGRGQGWVQS